MLTSRERESLIVQQYWFIMATFLVMVLHYFVLGFPQVYDTLPPLYQKPLLGIYGFMVRNVPWLINPWYILLVIGGGTLFYGVGAKSVKSTSLSARQVWTNLLLGFFLLVTTSAWLWYDPPLVMETSWLAAYVGGHLFGQLMLTKGATQVSRLMQDDARKDIFNEQNQTFPQEERLLENNYSVNIPTQYVLGKRIRQGWINVVNPFRGGMVLGTPGSGKSFVFVVAYIKQLLSKGFSMYIYDYKFDNLTRIAYNVWLRTRHLYKVAPKFFIINFDDPHKSHRCNPLLPSMMTDIMDAYESASTIMLNLNRSWISRQGDFFVESPINFVTANIWFLKLYEKGKYCTFPHVIELISAQYDEIFPILSAYPELDVYVKPFVSAYEQGAADQLEGQIASARIGLARLASPQLYWTMSGNDFTLDINNPQEPKILCVGNNPEREAIYGAALGLYNARLVKLVNKKGRIPSALIIDELATIYFKGLDRLIATARENLVATLLGFQDFSQLERDYGKPEATVTENIIGNIFVGQVTGDTGRKLSERFGKINQKKQSVTTSNTGTSVTISTQLDSRIPASVMAELSQGTFVGAVADEREQKIKRKVFHADVMVDPRQTKADKASFLDVPAFNRFLFQDSHGTDRTEEIIQRNYYRIRQDVKDIISKELTRIKSDPALRNLIKEKRDASLPAS